MMYRMCMKPQSVYSRIKLIAEMEDCWEHPDLIVLRMVREGLLAETKHVHPDRIKAIDGHIELIKEIRDILKENERRRNDKQGKTEGTNS